LNLFRLVLLLSMLIFCGCSEKSKVVSITTTPDYKKGLFFFDQQSDSAYYYFNKVVNNSKDSLQIAIAYNSMAVIQAGEGDYFGGQESLLSSLKYLNEQKEDNRYCLTSDYNELGSMNSNLKNYDVAIDYFDRALTLAKDDETKAIALNNKAFAMQQKGEFAKAAAIYESILPKSKKNKKEYARVLCNWASVRWLRDPDYPAAPELLTALEIRRKMNDEWGLNSSYAHLSDYYRRSRPDSALYYSRAMYEVARRLNSPDDQLEALQKLILLGPPGEAKTLFYRYQQLRDSLETARNRAKNQFASIRYDAEKNKTENLRLSRENAERWVEIVKQRVMSVGVTVAFLALSSWGIFWYRRRKRNMELEKQSAIQEDRLQLSKKVHDGVANRLYHLMAEIEYGENMDKEVLLDKIEPLYLQSRDISYEPVEGQDRDFQATLHELMMAFAHPDRKIVLTGNNNAIWEGVGEKGRKELGLVLRELMVNMDKHSRAQNVIIRFEREKEEVRVGYRDDGVGFPPDFRYGNGLTNTENRILGMGGRLIFEQGDPTGLIIRIYLPNKGST
jgi:tetratricopeptide (TPR) repeat protein